MATLTPTAASGVDRCEYEKFNATTGCYKPRACADCLREPGCMIGRSGKCQLATSLTEERNYTRAIELKLALPAAKDTMNDTTRVATQEWEFPSSTASYCPVTDKICDQCVQQSFWATATRGRPDSRFCLGASGCVCVFNCETSKREPLCPAAGGSSSGSKAAASIAVGDVMPTWRQCRYTNADASTTGACLTLRSCRDCLNKPGCRIATDGYCEAADGTSYYGTQYNYRNALSSNLSPPAAREANASGLIGVQKWIFPSSDVNYCPTNDTTCAECTQQQFWLSPGAVEDSHFCVGASGCVCIANCAREDTATYCPATSRPDNEIEISGEGIARAVTMVALIVIFFVLFAATRRANSVGHVRRMLRPPASWMVPQVFPLHVSWATRQRRHPPRPSVHRRRTRW